MARRRSSPGSSESASPGCACMRARPRSPGCSVDLASSSLAPARESGPEHRPTRPSSVVKSWRTSGRPAMSRIGRLPITVPASVEVSLAGREITVQGPKGTLSRALHPDMRVVHEGSTLTVERPSEAKHHKQLHGLPRTLVANMVIGVTDGYSHLIDIDPPAGIACEVESPVRLTVVGIDKELVGQVAAKVRASRKPEPYKGKGVHYLGEKIRRKAGKAGKIGGKK